MEGPETDPLGNPWYLVTDGATTGWVFGDFLRRADQPASPDDGTAPAAPEAPREQRRGTATGSFMYPVERFQFTQGFGCSPYPWFYAYDAVAGCNVHDGIDLAAAMYTAVLAADGGTVDQAGWCDCGLGYYVKLDHGDGLATVYGHLAEWPPVAPGRRSARATSSARWAAPAPRPDLTSTSRSS
jgi:murein DD-endopeptidase MepM/ murein hydrolase activator NlpD